MATFKKLINPPIKASEINSESATDGQVLTANGTGGATWQDAKGTEVVANPVLAGTESDLTGLEVAGTKYKVPSGGSGGGTQLYMHKIVLSTAENVAEFTLYATRSNFTLDTLIDYVFDCGKINVSGFKLTVDFDELIYPIQYIESTSTIGANKNLNVYYIDNNKSNNISFLGVGTSFNDTVTPL